MHRFRNAFTCRQGLLEEGAPLTPGTTQFPEVPQRSTQPQSNLLLSVVNRPSQRRPQVIVLCPQACQPHALPCAPEVRVDMLREVQVVRRMGVAGFLQL